MADPGDRAETQQQQLKGPEAFLSGEERKQLQRMLGFPEDLPMKYKQWMTDYLAVNGLEIPISQVRGYENAVQAIVDTSIAGAMSQFQSQIYSATVGGAAESTSSASYTNLATTGPTISGAADGSYIIWLGCFLYADADVRGAMSLSINAGTAVDADAVQAGVDGLAGDEVRMSISRAVTKTLSGGSNTIQAKYKKIAGSGDPNFSDRWIIALRVGT